MHAWTEEHQQIRAMLKRWVDEKLAPKTEALETEQELPYALMRDLFQTFGVDQMVAARFDKLESAPEGTRKEAPSGFLGEDTWGTLLGVELCRENPGFMLAMGASLGLAGGAIMRKGTRRQKLKWGRPIMLLEKIGCWGMTEPEAGSDAFGSMRTTAKPDGEHYILNGEKTFITNAPHADISVVYAKIDDGSDVPLRSRPFHAFVIETGTEGFERSKAMKKMGMHSSPTGSLFMSDVRVPKANLLGENPEGSSRAEGKNAFSGERTAMLPMCLGIIERCLDDSIEYSKTRKTWGRPISEYQLVQEKIARMYVARTNVENLLFKDLWRQESGVRTTEAEACMCKLYAARSATECALEAIQILGGAGYTQEHAVERLMRDAKLLQIGGGTDEIQIIRIAQHLLRD